MGANRRTRRARERAERKARQDAWRTPGGGHDRRLVPPLVWEWEPEIEFVILQPGEVCPVCECFGVVGHDDLDDEEPW